MRAIVVQHEQRAAELLELPTPEPASGQLLVAVRASSVNGSDLERLACGHPPDGEHAEPVVLGRDFAGVVAACGELARGYREGDEVFGCLPPRRPAADGAWADFVLVAADGGVAHKPGSLGYLPAAVLPAAGGLALSTVDAVALHGGDRVLVVGASGGAGGYVVQLAAGCGAEVIASSNEHDERRLRSLGAASVVPDTREGAIEGTLAAHPSGVDCLIDLASAASDFAALSNLVRPGGRAVTTRGLARGAAFGAGVIVGEIMEVADALVMAQLSRLADLGRLRSTIAGVYSLEQAGEALDTFASGVPGKISLLLTDED